MEAPPIDITFKNLQYTVKIDDPQNTICKTLPKIQKQILKSVSGIIPHHQITGILGASGAGKTSLLNILSCRIKNNQDVILKGQVRANRKEYDVNSFGSFANYVMQNDILMQTFTPKQALMFAAKLKLDQDDEQIQRKVNTLIKDLKLQKCQDTYIGGLLIKGISGGQRKRTSIGFELISDPQVLFLDQPTSGLDSFTAAVIVSYMKKLTHEKNKTVLMTIHQPNSEIFELFDRIILMVGGKIIYQGDQKKIVKYFDQNLKLQCPKFSNPADYLMSIMHHQNKGNVQRYEQYFSSYNYNLEKQIQKQIEESTQDKFELRQLQTSFITGLWELVKRQAKNTTRNPLLFRSRFIQAIILALVSGFIFFDLNDQNNIQAIYNRAGCLFFLAITNFMSSLSPVILTFPIQRDVFVKQENSKLYSTLSYYLSKSIMDLPMIVLPPIFFSLIIYWLAQLADDQAKYVFIFILIAIMQSFAGSSFGFFIGSIFIDAKVASSIMPLMILPAILFAGFFKNRQSLPVWIGWIEYISPIKYAFGAFTINQFDSRNQVPKVEDLYNFGLTLWQNIIILLGLGIGIRTIAFFCLYLKRGTIQ